MAGVVPKRTSGRKQWTLHDGPRSSLKRLRSQMATDGCPESQVVLAKQLLDERCEHDTETKENERLGVYWLIKASEQGNIEATNLLKTCLQTGKGITELNYLDVKSCITMTQDEKLARRAAREMFASLSNGGEYITSDQLQRKILTIDRETFENGDINRELVYDDSESDEEMDWSQKSDSSNEKLTEENVVTAAVDYSRGHLPVVSQILCLSDPNLRALDHIPLVQRSILHPVLSIKIIYYKLMKFLGRQFSVLFPLAKSEIQLFGLVLIYALISTNNVLFFFPMLLYYASFIVMVVSTFHMLQTNREFHDFRLWSGLFICYSGGSLNSDEAEFQYICNNLKPYGVFFGALLINLVIYPLIATQWIPQSELTVMSFCLTFMTLLGLLQKRRGRTVFDFLVFLSFGINVLAKYPYETDPVVAQGWRFLDLKIPTFATYVIGNGIEFCINFRLVLYLCIPVILVKIASRDHWRGTYKTLIPHCVTLSWLQVCIISSQGATMFGLLRGSLALVGFVLFLPLVGLTSVILPAVALTKWLITSNVVVTLGAFIVITLLGLGLFWMCAQTRFRRFVSFVQVCSIFVATYFILSRSTEFKETQMYYSDDKLPEFLSWEVYQRFCHQPVWQEENIAIAQMKCAELENSYVHWGGYINDIKIKTISNTFKNVFDKFPTSLKQYLYCFLGEKTRNDCDIFPTAVQDECNSFYNSVKSANLCSLEKYNYYTFEITVRLSSGIWGKSPEISVIVDDYFKNFSLNLKPNDHIWFKGTLFNNEAVGADGILGGFRTHVSLEEMGCFGCSNSKLTSIKREGEFHVSFEDIVRALVLGFKFVLNILLNPVVFVK